MSCNQVGIVNCDQSTTPNRPCIVVIASGHNRSTVSRSITNRKQQPPKKRVLKRNSDPVQLKQAVQQFLLLYWNVEPQKARPVGRGWPAPRKRPLSGSISNKINPNLPPINYAIIKRSASVTELSQVRLSLSALSLEGEAIASMVVPLDARRLETSNNTHLDLSRLRLRVEKRIERRRSLTHANNQLHNHIINSESCAVVEKYSTKLCKGRRALSDLALDCMDPATHLNIEELTTFQRKGRSGYNTKAIDPLALRIARNQPKRVSFSAPTTIIYMPRDKSASNLEAVTFLQPKQQQLFINLHHNHRQTTHYRQHIQQRIQPILTKGSSRLNVHALGPSQNTCKSHKLTTIGADYSSAEDYPLSHMDFATFKAWRRGSRLSIDVLDMLHTEAEKSQVKIRQQKSKRPPIQVVQLLKKMLSGCFLNKK